MQTITTTIDTVYDSIIKLTMKCIGVCIELYTQPPLSETSPVGEVKPIESAQVPVDEVSTFKGVSEILGRDIHACVGAQKNTIMYTHTIEVPVYQNPTVEFDSQIGTIPYGEMIIVLEPKGRFYRIVWNEIEGWVLRDDIADRAVQVHPMFVAGEENSVDHPNTAHVRAIVGDIFGLSRSEFPLQAGEYILYRLWKKGVKISWPNIRPRVPGLWHKILRGVPNVHIGVMPKVGFIMEYMLSSEIGHLAYVEAVFPDNTITISEVNNPDSGVYSERVLTKEKWKELKPVFIEVK